VNCHDVLDDGQLIGYTAYPKPIPIGESKISAWNVDKDKRSGIGEEIINQRGVFTGHQPNLKQQVSGVKELRISFSD